MHQIKLLELSTRLVHSKPYHAGPKARELEKAKIDKMLHESIVEPTQTECASPIVFAHKKDGTFQFCDDCRKSNLVTERDSYPIPQMDRCIDSLGDAIVLLTLDANSGYWHIELYESDRDKAAFTSHHGLYQIIRMPLGLRNSFSTFQRTMNVRLPAVRW